MSNNDDNARKADVIVSTTTAVDTFRGVTYERGANKWRARIYHRGRHVTLGRFASPADAAAAHDRAAYFVYGEGAVTNFGHEAARVALRKSPPTESEPGMVHLRKMASEIESNHVLRQQAAVQSGALLMLLKDAGGDDRFGSDTNKDRFWRTGAGLSALPPPPRPPALPRRRLPTCSSSESLGASVASRLRALVRAAAGIDSAMPRARKRKKQAQPLLP